MRLLTKGRLPSNLTEAIIRDKVVQDVKHVLDVPESLAINVGISTNGSLLSTQGYSRHFDGNLASVVKLFSDHVYIADDYPIYSIDHLKTLKALISIDKRIKRFPVLFRTEKVGNVQSVIDNFDLRTSNPQTPKVPMLYHGTSSAFHAEIGRKGLRPRKDTNSDPTFGAGGDRNSPFASIPDRVYLGNLVIAKVAAEEAMDQHGGFALVYAVRIPDENKLLPDEDSRKDNWWESLRVMGTVAYRGRIPYAFMHPYLANTEGGGENWHNWDGSLRF